MRISLYFIMGVAFLSSLSPAQTPEKMLPGAAGPGMTASVFAPGLVSGAGQEFGVAVTKDWSEIYFTRLSGEQSFIMQTHRTGEKWSTPVAASFSGQHNDSHPCLAPSGDQLCFVSRRKCEGASQDLNVWMVERKPNGWSAARSPGSPLTDQTVHAPSISADGSLYATGLIRLKNVDGTYEAAEWLTPNVKGKQPAVAPNENFVIFSAMRADRFGSMDIYVIFQNSDHTWSEPVNLGAAVNTKSRESSPMLSADGRFLFFSRSDDVWWVDAAVIESVRPK